MPYIDRTSKYSRMRPKRDTVGYLHKLPLTEISCGTVYCIVCKCVHLKNYEKKEPTMKLTTNDNLAEVRNFCTTPTYTPPMF